jgi:Domain of unknown function (DUF5063)
MAGDFEQLARGFCEFCERDKHEGRLEFANELERHLGALYGAAVNLMPSDPPDEDAPHISQQEWRAVYDRVATVLGDANHYWLIDDPFAQEAPDLGDLADDVADTYRDLKEGVALLDAIPAADPSWRWRQSFTGHWGRHAALALYALRVIADGGSEGLGSRSPGWYRE